MMLTDRLRQHLVKIAQQGQPITYQALARRLDLAPPNTIQQLTTALEHLMEEDAAAERPLIAALVVSKSAGGLPRQGFFECAARIGCFEGDALGAEAARFHATEFEKMVAFWGSGDVGL
jgi:hypothetical protein